MRRCTVPDLEVLAHCPQLDVLELRNVRVASQTFAPLASLGHLRELHWTATSGDVEPSQVTRVLPHLTSLERLTMSGFPNVQWGGGIVPSKVTRLGLQDCTLKALPTGCVLAYLVELDVTDHFFDDLGPLAALSSLRVLCLRMHHRLVRIIYDWSPLAQLTLLEKLHMRGMALTKLQVLDIDCRNVKNMSPLFGKLRQLEELSLQFEIDCYDLQARLPALRRVTHGGGDTNCLRYDHKNRSQQGASL